MSERLSEADLDSLWFALAGHHKPLDEFGKDEKEVRRKVCAALAELREHRAREKVERNCSVCGDTLVTACLSCYRKREKSREVQMSDDHLKTIRGEP